MKDISKDDFTATVTILKDLSSKSLNLIRRDAQTLKAREDLEKESEEDEEIQLVE